MANRHSAPKYLPKAQQDAWNKRYSDALKQAAVNYPDDEQGQHTAAHKEANKMLAVPAPTSAAEIDKLEGWQVTHRETKLIDDVEHRVCVTIDGRKYAFPVTKKQAAA